MANQTLLKPRYEARPNANGYRVFDTFTQSFVEFEQDGAFSYAIGRARLLNDAYERALK